MRQLNRDTATREELLWEMDKKTAALKIIHRKCNEILDRDDLNTEDFVEVKQIRYMAGASYPVLEPQEGDRLVIHNA